MGLFRRKAVTDNLNSRRGWWPMIWEPWSGAWQRNRECSKHDELCHFAVFSCMTLIASDISKLRLMLMRKDSHGIWSEITNPAFSPVLRKPNAVQTRIQFWEHWVLSKLSSGNVYVLKGRDERGVVNRLWILNPFAVRILVSESGDVFYRLDADNIAGIQEDQITVPSSEIIHDRFNTLFHPLVGLSPLIAASLGVKQGINIQRDSSQFFQNRAIPAGIITVPGAIDDSTAKRIKESWEQGFGGEGRWGIGVLADGMKFEAMRATAESSQVVEQLRWTAEMVCSCFHVPPYKIGIGDTPSYNNIQALNIEYFSTAIQKQIEDIELVLDEGLRLPEGMTTKFDIDGLLRMDTQTQMDSLEKGVKAGVLAPDEGRKKINLGPVEGGSTPYLQQQNYSLSALARRDLQEDPFNPVEVIEVEEDQTMAALGWLHTKSPESYHEA